MTLSVGLLSTAHGHADVYADALTDHEDVTLAGVTDSSIERGDDGTDLHGSDDVSAPTDLLNRVDAAVICSPNADHPDWFERAAAADVAVLCESPLATTAADAEAMVETWRETGIVAGVAMPLRFSDPVYRARETLAQDEIGPILSISGTNRGPMPGGPSADPGQVGGGAVMNHTAHIVDLVAHLFDEWPTEVYAETGTRMYDVEVEDVNVLSMELRDGTPFLLDGSWTEPDIRQPQGDPKLEILGRYGTISIDCLRPSVTYTVESGSDPGVNMETYGVHAYTRLVNDFVTAVGEGHDPEVTPTDGLRATRVIESAYESAEAEKPINVQL